MMLRQYTEYCSTGYIQYQFLKEKSFPICRPYPRGERAAYCMYMAIKLQQNLRSKIYCIFKGFYCKLPSAGFVGQKKAEEDSI
jgi:hypothetical protein